MATDPERVRRQRLEELAIANAARRLQRQEEARALIEEGNRITRRGPEDEKDPDGEDGPEA